MNSIDATLFERLRYTFERTLSKGMVAVIFWLSVGSALIIAVAVAVLLLFALARDPADPTQPMGVWEATWHTLMRSIDPGNVAADESWGMRAVMLVVTFGGIFVVSALIGAITTGLEGRVEEMRKGRTRVVESGHLLIMGWNSKAIPIVADLALAPESERFDCVVVLADRDKVEMEDEMRARLPAGCRTRVVCRTGDPLDLDDLRLVAPELARAVVVLAPEDNGPDLHVIKAVLAINNYPPAHGRARHVVAEISDADNLSAAALAGGADLLCVHAEDLMTRVIAQTCRQVGLSAVYTELLSFDGAELYTRREPELVGRTYREALLAMPRASLIGLVGADGRGDLNRPMDHVIAADEHLVVLADDPSQITLGERPQSATASLVAAAEAAQAEAPERTLILGWSPQAQLVVEQLDEYVAPGSEVVVLCQREESVDELEGVSARLTRQSLRLLHGDPCRRADLDALDVTKFDHVIVLSDPTMPAQEADARTLIALLHLRNIVQSSGVQLSIVSEMRDLRNRALAQVARADDFIVSDQLVSLAMAQLSVNRHIEPTLKQLFDSAGAEIYIRPASWYVQLGVEVDFYTVVEAAARRGETAIGFRVLAGAAEGGADFGIQLNPAKSTQVRFAEADRVIVLAHD